MNKQTYRAALTFLRALTPEEIAETGKRLFPDNVYQRILLTCYVRTIQNCEKQEINPRYYVGNLMGPPGFGKSGLIYSMGHSISKWLSAALKTEVPFRVVTCTLAGLNDVGDGIGIMNIDKDSGKTKIHPHENFPTEDNPSLGIIFVDDFNRGHDSTIAGFMEMVNSFSYNGYKVPVGWGMVAASNPQGGMHKVRHIDEAQYTRFVPLAYNPPRELFLDQLVIQGAAPEIIAYATRYREVAAAPLALDVFPEERPINWRNFMIFTQLYPVLKHDPAAKSVVSTAIFGPTAIQDLEAVLQDEVPLSPEDILGGTQAQRAQNPDLKTPIEAWCGAESKLSQYIKDQRTDLIAVAIHRLVHFLNQDTTELSEEQTDILAELIMFLPDQYAGTMMRRLVGSSAPRKPYYQGLLTHWNSPDGRRAGPVGQRFLELASKLKDKLAALKG